MNVIPHPQCVTKLSGQYVVPHQLSITAAGPEISTIGNYLTDVLNKWFNIQLELVVCKEANISNVNGWALLVDPAAAENFHNFNNVSSAYELDIASTGASIRACATQGLFYGCQTLLQLMQSGAHTGSISIDCMKIVDAPCFSWRGVLLDVGRHFYDVPFIKKLLDLMALYKLNRLHWHLTEDQGWRLEVKCLPRLTEVGAWRGSGDQRYGGYYTHEQVQEVVAYAAERFIDIIPEIELPGHCCAALASYPTLSCTGQVVDVPIHWGIHEDVYCAGSEEVFEFLGQVFEEVAALFPFKYVHIGGDECPKIRWTKCPRCQARIHQEGLADESELQSYFIKRAGNMLAKLGRVIIGWDEILEGGLPPGATVMAWRGMAGGAYAARAGHDVVMTPTSHCYFDYRQQNSADEPGAWYGLLPLHVVYSFDPLPPQPVLSSREQPPPQAHVPMASAGDAGTQGSGMDDFDRDDQTMTEAEVAGDGKAAGGQSGDSDATKQDTRCSSSLHVPSASQRVENPSSCRSSLDQSNVPVDQARRILGSQANLWTEYVENATTAEYMLLPRLPALAESIWSSKDLRDWDNFYSRVSQHCAIWERLQYHYRPL